MQTNIGKKLISKLLKKKIRYEEGLFVAEGKKIVSELLASGEVGAVAVYIREDNWEKQYEGKNLFHKVSEKDFKKISSLETSQGWLGVFRMPEYVNKPMKITWPALVFDTIQDPGNLGTIIRTADWFGIDTIVCSTNSADIFSPKVVQASMGAIARVKVYYTELEHLFEQYPEVQVLAMAMDGENIYKTDLPEKAFYLFGNESKGINKNLYRYATQKLTIPNFSDKPYKTESLNVAVSAAITMSLTKVKK